eukprot:Protomagalhaensia_wolfi_Nauph_80__876@NODE_1505_length_1496_cov_29_474262_g1165_i0_p1_GENE_NODE_1505_length_1496_cov_29_474262_g1165_i0NODE_1505_length_1496_cov_29_474262_g1165_i0_p1_ORF_typecomplete_len169_score16_87_NODE_1505_length_1496_cov_29_474262_g1165_i036542
MNLNSIRQLRRCQVLQDLIEAASSSSRLGGSLTNSRNVSIDLNNDPVFQIIKCGSIFALQVLPKPAEIIKKPKNHPVLESRYLTSLPGLIIVPISYSQTINIKDCMNHKEGNQTKILLAVFADRKSTIQISLNDIEFYCLTDCSHMQSTYRLSSDGKQVLTSPHVTWR